MLAFILGITKRGNKGITGQVLGTANWGKRD